MRLRQLLALLLAVPGLATMASATFIPQPDLPLNGTIPMHNQTDTRLDIVSVPLNQTDVLKKSIFTTVADKGASGMDDNESLAFSSPPSNDTTTQTSTEATPPTPPSANTTNVAADPAATSAPQARDAQEVVKAAEEKPIVAVAAPVPTPTLALSSVTVMATATVDSQTTSTPVSHVMSDGSLRYDFSAGSSLRGQATQQFLGTVLITSCLTLFVDLL